MFLDDAEKLINYIADVVYSLYDYLSSLKVHGPDLHFSSLSGVMSTLPFTPVDTTIARLDLRTVVIVAVQVGTDTAIVPPSTFIECGAVERVSIVIVAIFSGECHVSMITQGITSSSS